MCSLQFNHAASLFLVTATTCVGFIVQSHVVSTSVVTNKCQLFSASLECHHSLPTVCYVTEHDSTSRAFSSEIS